jgi:RNA polymerase sigma-70 factor (ECF subfamily)
MQGQPPPTTDRAPGSADALFEEAYRRCGTAVLGYAMRRAATRDDAFDIVAETFATAWRRRADMPTDPEQLRPWLFAIARHCLANTLRSHHRASRLGERLAAAFAGTTLPDPSFVHERRAEGRLVIEALEQLSPDDCQLVTMIAWEGMTPAQAAAVLGVTPGTARVRLHRARVRLRAVLEIPAHPLEADRDH